MITLPTFQDLYNTGKNEIETKNTKLNDFNEGSVLDANIGASSAIGMDIVYRLGQIIRAFYISTATKEDLEKRVRDFNIEKKKAEFASSGTVKLTRSNTSTPKLISKNSTFQCSSDGTSFYNPNDILFTTGTSVIENITLIANIAGSSSNVLANTIDTIIPSPQDNIIIEHPIFTNGIDEETDQELRNRFVLELQNMVRGTLPALTVGALRHTGISNAAAEKIYSGFSRLYISSGSGVPSNELINQVQADINGNWRAAGERVDVLPANTQNVDLIIEITIDPEFLLVDPDYSVTAKSYAKQSLEQFFQRKNMGAGLYLAELYKVIMSVNGIINVIIRDPSIDIAGQPATILRLGVVIIETD